ncbi:unnamed protein product [Urochloa humidicola]
MAFSVHLQTPLETLYRLGKRPCGVLVRRPPVPSPPSSMASRPIPIGGGDGSPATAWRQPGSSLSLSRRRQPRSELMLPAFSRN